MGHNFGGPKWLFFQMKFLTLVHCDKTPVLCLFLSGESSKHFSLQGTCLRVNHGLFCKILFKNVTNLWICSFIPKPSIKGENVLKGSLDLITSPSPSLKIQIIGRKLYLRQNIVRWCQQTFCFQKFVDNTQQYFAFTSEANFPAHNLNFHWRWWYRIQAT